jgi:hypothetical protein
MSGPSSHRDLFERTGDTSMPRQRRRRREDFPPLMPRPVASAYLNEVHGLNRHEPNTLAKMACIGRGPPFHKNGRWVLYGRDDLDRYAAERPRRRTPLDRRARGCAQCMIGRRSIVGRVPSGSGCGCRAPSAKMTGDTNYDGYGQKSDRETRRCL